MLATVVDYGVYVVDGEGMQVPDVEIGARYRYASAPATWGTARTDGNGFASFSDAHPEMPTEVSLFVGDDQCGTYPLKPGAHLTIEM